MGNYTDGLQINGKTYIKCFSKATRTALMCFGIGSTPFFPHLVF